MRAVDFVPFDYRKCSHRKTLRGLLSGYFDETFVNHPEDRPPARFLPKLLKMIAAETAKYLQWLYLCRLDGRFIGFCCFQLDTLGAPLCKREGWGFIIRELYSVPAERRKGYAARMCAFAEQILRRHDPTGIYLTADPHNGVPFWQAMGYVPAGYADDGNGQQVFEKYFKRA